MKGKIFNAQEVQAMLNGYKVMFREVIKPYPILSDDKSYWEFKGIRWAGENSSYAKNFGDNARPEMPDLCPYQVGQKIFCKESFNLFAGQVSYKQDLVGAERYFWRPAKHMKQEHSRLTLLIKEIGVDKLINITEDEVRLEGFNNKNEFLTSWKKKNKKSNLKEWVWILVFQKA